MDTLMSVNSYDYADARHSELLAISQRERLLRQGRPESRKTAGTARALYRRGLLGLSSRLIGWGTSLEQRYRTRSDQPAARTYAEQSALGK